ncbi:MAG: hypothetical protein HYW88_01210 [Candidatus Sungbacteria bacterium]|nr:hypothetical protein [Candidatus Sungbacteria bacterium]
MAEEKAGEKFEVSPEVIVNEARKEIGRGLEKASATWRRSASMYNLDRLKSILRTVDQLEDLLSKHS